MPCAPRHLPVRQCEVCDNGVGLHRSGWNTSGRSGKAKAREGVVQRKSLHRRSMYQSVHSAIECGAYQRHIAALHHDLGADLMYG